MLLYLLSNTMMHIEGIVKKMQKNTTSYICREWNDCRACMNKCGPQDTLDNVKQKIKTQSPCNLLSQKLRKQKMHSSVHVLSSFSLVIVWIPSAKGILFVVSPRVTCFSQLLKVDPNFVNYIPHATHFVRHCHVTCKWSIEQLKLQTCHSNMNKSRVRSHPPSIHCLSMAKYFPRIWFKVMGEKSMAWEDEA